MLVCWEKYETFDGTVIMYIINQNYYLGFYTWVSYDFGQCEPIPEPSTSKCTNN